MLRNLRGLNQEAKRPCAAQHRNGTYGPEAAAFLKGRPRQMRLYFVCETPPEQGGQFGLEESVRCNERYGPLRGRCCRLFQPPFGASSASAGYGPFMTFILPSTQGRRAEFRCGIHQPPPRPIYEPNGAKIRVGAISPLKR